MYLVWIVWSWLEGCQVAPKSLMHGVCVWELRTMVTQDLTGGRSKVLSEFFIMGAGRGCLYVLVSPRSN